MTNLAPCCLICSETSKAFIENEENLEELNSFITTCENAKNVEELVHHPLFNNSTFVFESDESLDSGYGAVEQRDTRLTKEFIIQRSIGKGAFGTVLQVRNKVDWNDYAVKCIRIDPLDEDLLTKITREAKLVSKLNHPNVVRYYNSWIGEVALVRPGFSPKGKSLLSEEVVLKEYPVDEDSLLPSRLRNVEQAAEGLQIDASEWTASCRGVKAPSSSDDSSDDESDEQQGFAPYSEANSDSFSILFEHSSSKSSTPSESQSVKPIREVSPENEKSLATILSDPSVRSPVAHIRILYIQMEYCGGGTLRNSIDMGHLRGNPRMIWKLFAEILSGLDYIHRQGMIHRDIKPMNILLDIEGRVKIGDFGLATKDLLLRRTRSVDGAAGSASLENALTKDIGTETYMAPELFDVNNVEPYTSKIDVYSTGIVFFEMCYKPLFGMERPAVFSELKVYGNFPGDFGEGFSNVQARHVRHLIKWMLQAEADRRPTVEELMRDNLIPLVEDEDNQFKRIFSQALKNRSRTYYWMLDTITKEEQPAARTFCFDQDTCKEKFASSRDEYIDRLRSDLSYILKLHAFVPLNTHLLVPKSKNALESCKSMRSKPSIMVDDHGNVVMLPIDLRQNFVRYCARNSINRMKRYTFDRVYANKDASEGVHPSETYECCVDSVGAAAGASTLTADLLSVVTEISSKILAQYRCMLRIGHMGLIEAAMIQAGIPAEKKAAVLQSMQEDELVHSYTHMAKIVEAVSKHVGENTARRFFALLPKEGSLSPFKEKYKGMLRSRDAKVKEASRNAFSDLEKITQLLSHASCSESLDILFDGATVYRPSTFGDGIVFHLTCALPNPKRGGTVDVVFLAGGRYDSLLRNELHPQDIRPAHSLCLVGFSISLNVLAEIRRKFSNEKNSACDALVCSYSQPLLREKFELVKMMRRSGISTDIMHEPVSTVPEILEHCIKSNISNLLVVFDDDEVLVMSNSIDHGKMTFAAALDCISKKNEDSLPKSQQPAAPSAPATFANCVIVYAVGERPALNTRRKIENQIRVGMVSTFAKFSSSEKIMIFVTSLPVEIIKSVASALNKGMTLDEANRVFDTLCKSCGKSKEDMEFLYEHMERIFAADRRARPAIIIYRQQDSFYRVIS
ncbi:kinase domain protein [Oesophagostomum dentatum]|uniref:Kinase domain protein n=1 Tax=Oesophagostomum dentatum TaxID=61180 RepID=A0A0B1TJE8_OESDE|nr:kinase domain protein [Oesophagostomum dentatum]